MACKCTGDKTLVMANWRIVDYKCNHSAFSGGRCTRSDYSSFVCGACLEYWRSKANYVYKILPLSQQERAAWHQYRVFAVAPQELAFEAHQRGAGAYFVHSKTEGWLAETKSNTLEAAEAIAHRLNNPTQKYFKNN